jgi:hypothetical protein
MEREAKIRRASAILSRFRSSLDIGYEDVGTMFGVPGQTARAWHEGKEEVPETVFARMIAAESALNRLVQVFRPDRLGEVIRRRAPAFDNERALDWILDGRIAEVAARYDAGLSFLVKKPA